MKNKKIALVLLSASLGGTERRIGYLFKFLSEKFPGKYHLVINRSLYDTLQKASYSLDACNNVHIIESRSILDRKTRAHQNLLVQIGRAFTLFKYRSELKRILKHEDITTIQVYLEMVPFLGVFPLRKITSIASLVSHLPKYYDPDNINCKLLLYALKTHHLVDALYPYIGNSVIKIGIPGKKVFFPEKNFVNHIIFRPEAKENIVTFSSRMHGFKNPMMLIDAICNILPLIDDDYIFYIMGQGELLEKVKEDVDKKGASGRIVTGFFHDPSVIINKSKIHLSIERYDNFTNQSLLEGMASGCAIIASDVGMSSMAVTPDTGMLTDLTVRNISDCLLNLINNPDKTKTMGLTSRKKILQNFSIDNYIEYIEKLHEHV